MSDETIDGELDAELDAELAEVEAAEDWRDLSRAALLEVQAIAARDGKLTPEAVLDEAVDPASPLHDQFTWDETAAAHLYRLEEARRLIRKVQVLIVSTPTEIIRARAFVVPERGSGSYIRFGEAKSDPERRAALIKWAVASMRSGVTQLKPLVLDVEDDEPRAVKLLADIEAALARYDR